MEKMHFAGVINSEETVSGLLPDGRRIFVQILSIFPMPTVADGLDPLYWLGRLEAGEFEDEENSPIVWVEMARAEQEMQVLDKAVDPDGLDKEGQQAWAIYQAENAQAGICPCGVEGCRGLDWLLDGNDPY